MVGAVLMFGTSGFAQDEQRPNDPWRTQDALRPQGTEKPAKGGVATLYALDPLANSFCFRDAGAGKLFQQHAVKNRCSDVNYHSYHAGQFAIGVEGGRVGAIVDLGTAIDLKKEYGYDETVGNGQGFASIHLEKGKLVILKDRRERVMQDLKETAQLFAPPKSGANAPVKVGHIYLARITDRHDSSFQLLVKLLVISHTPGESVTTGASSGIGEVFARKLAARGRNVLLVARSEDKLITLCNELGRSSSIRAQYVALDLSEPDAAERLFAEAEKRSLSIDLLVNNAGFGSMGEFSKLELARELNMIDLNIKSLVELTYRFLGPMRERKQGTIINVASTAAFQGVPFMATYAATKAFVLSFSEALWEENRPFGIKVMALCPGVTAVRNRPAVWPKLRKR